jgi:hypothetical protein
MDWLTFIAAITKALAWPGSLVAVVLILRKSLLRLLPQLERLEYKNFKLEFSKRLAAAEHQVEAAGPLPPAPERKALPPAENLSSALATIASLAPRAAIADAWRAIEFELDDIFSRRGLPRSRFHTRQRQLLQDDAALPPGLWEAVEELRRLRNAALHEVEPHVSEEQAREYLLVADRILSHLRQVPSSPPADKSGA